MKNREKTMFKTEFELSQIVEKLLLKTKGAQMDKHTFIHAFKLGYYNGFDDHLKIVQNK